MWGGTDEFFCSFSQGMGSVHMYGDFRPASGGLLPPGPGVAPDVFPSSLEVRVADASSSRSSLPSLRHGGSSSDQSGAAPEAKDNSSAMSDAGWGSASASSWGVAASGIGSVPFAVGVRGPSVSSWGDRL